MNSVLLVWWQAEEERDAQTYKLDRRLRSANELGGRLCYRSGGEPNERVGVRTKKRFPLYLE